MSETYDVIIIGGGPGGYVAAIRAAQIGLKTAVVEREHLGGICLNWGCIPTKALLRSAEIYGHMQHAENFGLSSGEFGFDINKVVSRSRGISGQLATGVGFLLKKNKVDVIWGEAKISKPGEVVVSATSKPIEQPQNKPPKTDLGEGTYLAKNIIIATGARPRVLPGIEPDGELIWTYFDAMKPKTMPKSLVVMGSGAIGIEFASFYKTMGADVTVVELMPQVMPVEDIEISKLAQKQLEKAGIKFLLEAKVTKVEKSTKGVSTHIELKDGSTEIIKSDRLISAVGVMGNTENLGLEALGVELDRGIIQIDDYGRTNIEGILAIGDVAGAPMLAHKAGARRCHLC